MESFSFGSHLVSITHFGVQIIHTRTGKSYLFFGGGGGGDSH